ncbi:MAG: hypothetical protein ABIJ48_11100 [Actinomycetota bacterium]
MCTAGASIADPQVLTTSLIGPRTIDTTRHGAYPTVATWPGSSLRLYGAKTTYTY